MSGDDPYLLGIRHHGPGSAASLRVALAEIQPDCILLEGPPEGDELLPLADDPSLQPPVGLLCYAEDDPGRSVVYPFVEYSPEWQAIRYARQTNTPLRFFDLPKIHDLAPAPAADTLAPEEDGDEAEDHDDNNDPSNDDLHDTGALLQRRDPLDLLAAAAGFDDGERWWEQLVEERHNGLAVFTGIAEAMTAVREHIETELATDPREQRREAWMRKQLRAARKEFQRIAVVCGAWHVPALARSVKVADDNAVLKGLPRIKVRTTWIPWSDGRIQRASGYGAGVASPGWYRHLWQLREREDRSRAVSAAWLSRVAALLREEGMLVSSANVIEAVRLAETLAALRGQPLPGLAELNEATVTTLCFGDNTPLRLIETRLMVGDRLGSVPERVPLPPLQQDLTRLQKRLRLKPEAGGRELLLDLRKPLDLERSVLLHRLQLLGLAWGQPRQARGYGTFKESWFLQWQPEFAIRLIELGLYGSTVETAAHSMVLERLTDAGLTTISALIDALLLAELPDALQRAVAQLADRAALAGDIAELMDALPTLAQTLRYGNVRGHPGAVLTHVVAGIVERICVGLPAACHALDDDQARQMLGRVLAVNQALTLVQLPTQSEDWWQTLERLAAREDLHGLLGGMSFRLLLGAERLDSVTAAQRLQSSLSRAVEPAHAAAWVEGLLTDSGLLLLHDERLWTVVDDWLTGLDDPVFLGVLPLLRRTFTNFDSGLRRQLLERVRQGKVAALPVTSGDFDQDFADSGLPLLLTLLGASHEPDHG